MDREMFDTPEGQVIRHTDKAVLFEVEGEEMWLPRSQIEGDLTDEYLIACAESCTPISFTIPEWLAETKGLTD
jgi:hypothetical protein